MGNQQSNDKAKEWFEGAGRTIETGFNAVQHEGAKIASSLVSPIPVLNKVAEQAVKNTQARKDILYATNADGTAKSKDNEAQVAEYTKKRGPVNSFFNVSQLGDMPSLIDAATKDDLYKAKVGGVAGSLVNNAGADKEKAQSMRKNFNSPKPPSSDDDMQAQIDNMQTQIVS